MINSGTVKYLKEEAIEIQRQSDNLNRLIEQHNKMIYKEIQSHPNDMDNINTLLNLLEYS